jgi:hypothetical protein
MTEDVTERRFRSMLDKAFRLECEARGLIPVSRKTFSLFEEAIATQKVDAQRSPNA